jgi:hypothetical protein
MAFFRDGNKVAQMSELHTSSITYRHEKAT